MILSELVKSLEGEFSCFRRSRTMRGYGTTVRCVIAFFGRDPKPGEVFNQAWLSLFQQHLTHKGLKLNTISFYMRMLRSIYNKSVDSGLLAGVPRLFIRMYTGLAPTVKRSLHPGVIHVITRAKVSHSLEFCRDMFVLCFRLQGMTFVDLAYLRKSDIQGRVITYVRRKCKSLITVTINDEAQKILNKYAHLTEGSEYVFPIITDPSKDPDLQRQSALRAQNRNLKKLSAELGLEIKLTTYMARHSWATMAYHSGVPTPVIKEALGHRTEEITRIYLASFGPDKLNEANEMVSRAVDEAGKEAEEEKNVRHLMSDGQKSDTNI